MKDHCPNPEVETRQCKLCGEVGHLRKECPTGQCIKGGGKGHILEDCTGKETRSCLKCKVQGHVAKDCPERPLKFSFPWIPKNKGEREATKSIQGSLEAEQADVDNAGDGTGDSTAAPPCVEELVSTGS